MRLLLVLVAVALAAPVHAAPGELYTAAKNGDEKAVAALLAAKAAVDEPGDQGWSPLLIAAYKGHLGVARRLLAAGADPNFADSSGFTPLLQAARFGHLEVVKLLHGRKARLDARPTGSALEGKTALHLALEDKRDEVARWLLDQAVPVNAQDRLGATPLMIVVRRGDAGLVKLLLARRADVKLADGQGNDALALAAMRGHVEVVTHLLAAGAVLEGTSRDGQTALFQAAHGGHAGVVKLLLAKGAAARVRERKFGDTALFRAAQGGHLEVVRLLLDAGAPVDEPNDAGETPLMAAAGNGAVAVIELLLERGADKDRRDRKERSATMRAQRGGHTRAAALLEARGAKVTQGERGAAEQGARERWFRGETISGCAMLDVRDVGLERCALSEPAGERARKFRLTVRDTSRLEPGDRQKANHVLVAELALALGPGEYADVDAAGHYALGGRSHLVFVPVVTGTPSGYTDGRVLLYLYEEGGRLREVWKSPPCGTGCSGQTVGTIQKRGKLDVEVRQSGRAGERVTLLGWDAGKKALVARP